MDVAYRLAEDNAPEGVVVFSEEQSHGRGRMGRVWVSPQGMGIYFSLILRPKILPLEAAKITLLAAVGTAIAIRKMSLLSPKILWPNDILINNRKVCGILIELSAELDRVKFLILGVGINVNTPKDVLPKGATSIREELGRKISRIEMAREVLRQIERYYFLFKQKKFSSIVREWKELSAILGSHIKVVLQGKTIEGQAQDINSHGALVVRLDNGFLEHIWAGDVVHPVRNLTN
jgi:BirA family biotin operon repressor/biotin-[acetyl-CoA-carboxylase] ligase